MARTPSIRLGPCSAAQGRCRVEVGPGLRPTPIGTTPPQLPPWLGSLVPPCPVPHLPQPGQAQGVEGGTSQTGRPPPPPTLSASAAKLVSHLPGACLGVVTSLVSCSRECRRGASPPSAKDRKSVV